MRRLVVALLGATVLSATAAQAADMPTKAPVYTPPPVVYNWSGCFLGVNAGGIWGRSNVNIPNYPSNFDINMSSFVGGGQVGCNYQMQQFVLGIEGNWDGMDLKGDAPSGVAGERYGVRWNWEASLRGRLGYAPMGTPWLIYVTGGAAWAHLSSADFNPAFGSTSGTHNGWTVGGGVEYQLTRNWIVGLEYRYADYGSKRYNYAGPVDVNLKTNAVMARLSYLFHLW